MENKYISIWIIILLIFISKSFAGAYIKKENESVFILENIVSSNNKYIFNAKTKDFKSIENKLYFEYGLGHNLALNSYIKSLDLDMKFDTLIENNSNNNYFYNLGLQYNILKVQNHYLTLSFGFYDKIKADKVLFTTSNNDIFTAFESGISYSYIFDNFFGYYNNNSINIDIKYKLLKDSYKDNLNININLSRKINYSSIITIEYQYSKDIIKDNNYNIDKFFYNGMLILNKPKIDNLAISYYTIKLSSVTHFNNNISYKIGIEKSFYNNHSKSYALSNAIWITYN